MPGRSFDALQRSLAKGEVQPVYYFFGDEELLKDDAVRRIMALAVDAATRDFNLDRRRAPELSADQFRSLVETPPMLAARRCVVLTEVECLQQRRPKQQALRAGRRRLPRAAVAGDGAGAGAVGGREAGRRRWSAARTRWTSRTWSRPSVSSSGSTIARRRGASRSRTTRRAMLQEAVGDDLPQLAAELAKLAAATAGKAVTVADVADLVGVRHGETVGDFVDAVTGAALRRRGGAWCPGCSRARAAPGCACSARSARRWSGSPWRARTSTSGESRPGDRAGC